MLITRSKSRQREYGSRELGEGGWHRSGGVGEGNEDMESEAL